MQIIVYIVLPFMSSLLLCMMVIPRILVVTYRKGLFDKFGDRKVHVHEIPRLGGASFLPCILFALLFTVGFTALLGMEKPLEVEYSILPRWCFLFCGCILLYFAGVKDDLIGLRYRSKFLIQAVAAGILVASGFWLNNLFGVFGIYQIPFYVGIPFTILAIIFVVNSMNLIDGIDGLASGLSGISALILGVLFFYQGNMLYAVFSFAIVGTLLPFFLYNVFGKAERCRKIFMGDTGSMTLGYLLAFLLMSYMMHAENQMLDSSSALLLAASTLFIPVFDSFRVMLHRARMGRPLFIGDKNHIHHKLLAIGFTPSQTLLTILGMSMVYCIINVWGASFLNINVLILIDILIYTGVNIWISGIKKYKKEKYNK